MPFRLERYACVDPRTLGLLRIGLGCLLLFDLIKRFGGIELWYVNSGLLPNHRLLWRPFSPFQLSYLYALWTESQVTVAFVVTAGVYLCFLVGYRTRWTHVLSWFALLSLHTRADFLANGGDYVFSSLMLWTAFLPLGARFSFDAILADPRRESVRRPPIRSFAVPALLLQLCIIYVFNAVHKDGSTWREASAVHYMLHQDRIVTGLGVWVREHAPFGVLQAMARAAVAIEYALPALILWPWFGAWPRRVAILLIWALHGGIACLANLGVFSPVMMVFSLVLVSPGDWAWLERAGQRGSAWLDARRAALARAFDWLGLTGASAVRPESRLARWRSVARELCVLALMILATSRMLNENAAIPEALKHTPPRFMRAAIGYLRLNQGWGMFAPDAPRGDMWIVVDAELADGRRSDPLNALGSRVTDPSLRHIPVRLDQDVYFCDYSARIDGDGGLQDSLSDWIFDHARRTRRREDRVVRFTAYVVEDDSPRPGEREPRNTRARAFLQRTR